MAKVMLVEDDNNLREIYEARLQAEGYDIVSAKDGEEALVVAKAEKPELVISDVMMPKISGFEMLDIMRNTDGLKDVKIIMLTALGQSEDQVRADKLGADRYLVKSQVTLEDIVKVAHELLSDEAAPATPEETPAEAPVPAAEEAPVTAEPVPAIEVAAPPAEPAPAISPAPAPIPVAEAPVATEPATAPAPEVPVTGANAQAEVDKDAPTTAIEEAAVEAKIEDFVAGATSEPTAPIPAPVAETEVTSVNSPSTDAPAPSTEPVSPPEAPPAADPVTPSPVSADAAATASDDKVMADAVNNLMADTEKTNPPAALPAVPVQPVAAAPEPTADPAVPQATEIDTPPVAPATPPVPVTGQGSQKVIQPIDAEPKKDLDALLAAEEAKDPSIAETPQAVVGGSDKPAPSPDPKDISL